MDSADKFTSYDTNFIKRPADKRNHLAHRVHKFQEIVNRIAAPPSVDQVDLAHRSQEIQDQIAEEMKQLCHIIRINGKEQDGTIAITFGDLFEIYTNISNKLVGILLKARRQAYLTFPGEMLLQNRDENVVIHLLRSS